MRRTKIDSDITRDHILDAAEYFFCKKGVSNTTLQMVASRAGVTRGAIYWHFPGKNDLVRGVVSRVHLTFVEEIEIITSNNDRPFFRAGNFLLKSLRDVNENIRLRNVLKLIFFSSDYSVTKTLGLQEEEVSPEKFINMIKSIIRSAKRKEEIKASIDEEMLSYQIFTIFSTTLRYCIGAPTDDWMYKQGKEALEMVISNTLSTSCKE